MSVLPDVLNRSTRLSVFCWKSDIRGDWTFALEGVTLCAERIGNHNADTQISFPKNGTKPPLRPMIPMTPPDTFLGFTHFCGKRRSNGAFTIWRKTAKKRMVAKLQAVKVELRQRMHEPIAEVGAWLQKIVTGYYPYHAVPANIDRLSIFG